MAPSKPTAPAPEARPGLEGRIHASIRIVIPPRKRKEALAILGAAVEGTRHEEGCLSCRLYRDVREAQALMLEEIWTSEACLEHHLRSEGFRTVLLVVEMGTGAPEIRFDRVIRSTGIRTIERARSRMGPFGSGGKGQED